MSADATGMPRWGWAVLTTLSVVTAVSLIFAFAQDSSPVVLPTPSTGPTTTLSSPTSSPPSASASAEPVADGCLGGQGDLDHAVLAAQAKAPLDEQGAAAFTATLIRWETTWPPSTNQLLTAKKVLAPDATSAAVKSLSSKTDKDTSGNWVSSIDFSAGKYYVEVLEGTSAVISWISGLHATKDGVQLQDGVIGGTVHLKAFNGVWRLHDVTSDRSLADLANIGTTYSGGC